MICCLNPHCPRSSPPCPDGTKYCSSCGTELVLLSKRYLPIERIGNGGFGVVYLAKDTEMFDSNCLIKQLSNTAQYAKKSFELEAQKLKELGDQSLQIPTLLAYPSDQSFLYLVQEFIQGQDLNRFLLAKGAFKEDQVKEFLDSLLPVLAMIHDKKIIHRDIKLENIMRRENGQLVLIDFGIAKQVTSKNPSTPGTRVGTPGYAPPEQDLKGIVKPASDLYSLGAACFHLLTGVNPYTPFETYSYKWPAHWQKYLKQPISKEFRIIIDKLLKYDHQDRYQSVEEVRKALHPPIATPVAIKRNRFRPTGVLIGTSLFAIGGGLVLVSKSHVANIVSAVDVSNAKSHYDLGQRLLAKDSRGAIKAFSKAIELNKNYTEAYLYRGLAKFDIDEFKSAIEDFSQVIKLNPNSLTAYAYRASAWSGVDNSENSIKDWKQATQIQPDDALSYNSLGNALSNSGKDKKAAVQEYDRAIALDPYLYRAYHNRAVMKYKLKDKKGAIEDLTQAIKIKPDFHVYYYNRALAKYKSKNEKGAIEDLTQAIKLKPNSPKAYEKRGHAKYDTNDKKGAIEDFTQSIKREPGNSESYYKRGNIRHELGDNEGTIKDFKKVVELYQKEGRNKDTDEVYKYVLKKLKELGQ